MFAVVEVVRKLVPEKVAGNFEDDRSDITSLWRLHVSNALFCRLKRTFVLILTQKNAKFVGYHDIFRASRVIF